MSSGVAGPAELSRASPRRVEDAPKAVRDALCGTEAPRFICATFVEYPRCATRALMCFSILLVLWEKGMETKH